MLKKIIHTVFSKGLIAILNFFIVMLTAKYTGAVGRGEISLMYLNISLVLMFNDIIGGTALIYLLPKIGVKKIVLPAFLTAICCGICLPMFFNIYLKYDLSHLLWFIALSLSLNLSSVCNVFLNGLQKINQNNMINVFQTIIIFSSIAFFVFILKENTSLSYFKCLFLGFSFNFTACIYLLRKELFPIEKIDFWNTIKAIISYGFIVQAGNLIQLLNYRITYYFLDYYYPKTGKMLLGIFSTGSSIAESTWVIMNGISMVQYATISNSKNELKNISHSIKLSKISAILTTIAILFLIFLPKSVFIFLFGNDFSTMQDIIKLLSPGIVIMAFTGIYSHYFAGTGLMKVSTYASLFALMVSLVSGILLIPHSGYIGAAITATLSYISSSLFLIIAFKHKTNCTFKEQFLDFKNVFKLTSHTD